MKEPSFVKEIDGVIVEEIPFSQAPIGMLRGIGAIQPYEGSDDDFQRRYAAIVLRERGT